MAVFLLKFEKAYDKVDWAFLGGTMPQLGFSHAWIWGVADLYFEAHSQVLVQNIAESILPFPTRCDRTAPWIGIPLLISGISGGQTMATFELGP